ncbi:alpha-L-fucosidase [Mycetocola zhadangensis]|uniref:alpha-L-fucosidase n=1 Tax=Mycetocola zhadangensis TaxID=1164595 RepID=A0A3L7IX39_9MICO|nr:alpha-L-fucosidase [Mycetocola zhadangensis]RLQ82715.1 glycosyl hydrolase [Mycetocola zhadangensis]GGE98809.1 hypothetical protein GCM10011313_22260 [Mycetocola zhadangensis]
MTDSHSTAPQIEGVEIDLGTDEVDYEWPTNPETLSALEHWRDLKVGVLIHWGIYSHIGQAGSWSLHREHLGDFTDPPADWEGTDAEYHDWYNNQMRAFSGPDYDAAEWAAACAGSGAKYMIFTAKHHDGFAMYDTRYSSFKSTSEGSGLKRDVMRETFDAFREENLEVGVYFSKADWNHPGYWDRAEPISDRFHNYDIAERPRQWGSFVDYTHAQIEELLTHYGKVNVLWLDAGWVREPAEPIDMPSLAANALTAQPDLLIVDRTVHGPYELYRTPEQVIPPQPISSPWESCIPMTDHWCSIVRDEAARPLADILRELAAVVTRGGNYLIGVGPDATGHLSRPVAQRLAELGEWLDANGKAVYGSRAEDVALSSDVLSWAATRRAEVVYAFGIAGTGEHTPEVELHFPREFTSARLMDGTVLPIRSADADNVVLVPPGNAPVIIVALERTEKEPTT